MKEREILEQILNSLKNILNNKRYLEDKNLIQDTILLLEQLPSQITLINLEKIKNNLNELDRKYDNVYDLINLYDIVYFPFKQRLHQEYVRQLREQNRKKRLKK